MRGLSVVRRYRHGVLWGLLLLLAVPVAAQPVSPETQAERLLVRGMTQAYLDDHARAIELYEQALRLTPGRPTLLSALADAYTALDDLASARFYARQALAAAPDNLHYHEQVIHLAMKAGDDAEALAACHTLLQAFPGHRPTLRTLARLEAAAGHPKAALEALRTLAARAAPDAGMLTEMLQLYTRLEDEAGMERTLRSLIRLADDPAEYGRMLARLYERQGRPDEAVTLYEGLLSRNPDDAATALALASAYREAGRSAEADTLLARTLAGTAATPDQLLARAHLFLERDPTGAPARAAALMLARQALARAPRHAGALRLIGDLFFDDGAYAAAADTLARALEADPRDPARWDRAVEAYLRAARPLPAARLAEDGLLLFPGRPTLLRARAEAALAAGDDARARAFLTDALTALDDTAPDDAPTRALLLATLARTHGEAPTRADSLLDRALTLAPAAPPVQQQAAEVYLRQGRRLGQALEMARQAREADPTSASFLTTLGTVHLRLDHLEEAHRWTAAALEAGGGAPALERAGDVLARMGRFDEARQRWQAALDRVPGRRSLQQKLEALAH